MHSERMSRAARVIAAIAVLALAACGGGSGSGRSGGGGSSGGSGSGSSGGGTAPAGPWQGQWTRTDAGAFVVNLRSDGAYSRIHYSGDIGTPAVWAEKGFYTFVESYIWGDGSISGTLQTSATHSYDTAAEAWEPVGSSVESVSCIVHPTPGLIEIDADLFAYYGPEAAIPAKP